MSPLGQKVATDGDGCGLAGIICVFFERESENRNMLSGDCVEEVANDPVGKTGLLPVIDLDDTLPVGGDFREAEVLTEIGKIEDVFLKAGTAVTDRCLEKLGADAGIATNRTGNFIDIGTGDLAQGGDGVDG